MRAARARRTTAATLIAILIAALCGGENVFAITPVRWDWGILGQELDGRQKRCGDGNLRQQHPIDGPFEVGFCRQCPVTRFAGGFHAGCDSLSLTFLYPRFLERAGCGESVESHIDVK